MYVGFFKSMHPRMPRALLSLYTFQRLCNRLCCRVGTKKIFYPEGSLLTSYREGAKLDGIKIYDREILFTGPLDTSCFKSIPAKPFR